MKHIQYILAVATACVALPMNGKADDFAEKARPIFTKNQSAVVTIQLVVKSKLSMEGRPSQSNESRQEVTGTVVDPSGLTAVSLSSVDPGQMVQNLMAGDRIKMETDLTDVKILMPDGTEIPSEVVLRDKDLDLAFLRPKTKPQTPMTALDFSQAGKAEVLDPVLSLNRLGNAAGRSYSASAERISAIVQRPRLFYIPDANMTTSTLGCPAFTMDGKVLGLFVIRAIKGGASTSSLNSQNPNYTGIIVPASDVWKTAQQVPPASQESAK